jgi:hypothetical protein
VEWSEVDVIAAISLRSNDPRRADHDTSARATERWSTAGANNAG